LGRCRRSVSAAIIFADQLDELSALVLVELADAG
jgi:hypothetical protein